MKIIDLHQDLLLYISRPDLYPNDITKQTSFEQIKKNNLKVVIATTFPVPDDEDYTNPITNEMIEKDIIFYNEYCARHPEFLIIKNKEDFNRVLSDENLFGLIIHIEGLNVFNEDTDWGMLEHWYDMGLRSIGPVWNLSNPFGGGTVESGGLTNLGQKLIAWCEQKGVIVDFAHMNQETFWDAVKIINKPIFVSHGNAYSVCENIRNYTDEQLQKIRDTKGCIGIFFSKKFLGREDESIVYEHINKILEIAGSDCIGIGSDYGGVISGFAEGFDSVDCLPKLISMLGIDIQEKISYKNAVRVIGEYLQ